MTALTATNGSIGYSDNTVISEDRQMRILSLLLLIFSPLFTGQSSVAAGELRVDVHFSSHETAVIREYFQDNNSNKPKGGKGAKSLPPGIEKNLQRGKALPPGIAKQALPTDLSGLLPPPASGYERIVVSGKILLIEIATQVIHDILTDAIL